MDQRARLAAGETRRTGASDDEQECMAHSQDAGEADMETLRCASCTAIDVPVHVAQQVPIVIEHSGTPGGFDARQILR